MFGSPFVKIVGNLQVGRVMHDAGWDRDIRYARIEAHCVFIEDIDRLDGFHGATMPVRANSGVFNAQKV